MPDNTLSTLSSLLPSNVVTAEFLRLFADRNTNFLLHPAIVDAGDAKGLGSINVKMSALGLDGYKILEPRAEGAIGTLSTLDDDEVNVVVGSYFKGYTFTDLALAILEGRLSPTVLARDAVMSVGNTVMSLFAALGGGFSNTSGTPGSALTAAQFLAAKAALGTRSIPGPLCALLSGVQHGHLQSSAAFSTSGAIQWLPATQQQIDAYGEGYKGKFAEVDIFVSNRIPTMNAGADHGGCMFGRGALVWAKSSFAREPDPNIIDFGASAESGMAPCRFERARRGTAGKSDYMTHLNVGVTEGLDTAGQSLITKATP